MRSPFKDISKKKEKLKKAETDASSGYALRSHNNSPDRADEDNDDVIESYSLYYIFSVFPSFVYY